MGDTGTAPDGIKGGLEQENRYFSRWNQGGLDQEIRNQIVTKVENVDVEGVDNKDR